MSKEEQKPPRRVLPPALGLGDRNIDPEILICEVDHDFFDNPPALGEDDTEMCQESEKLLGGGSSGSGQGGTLLGESSAAVSSTGSATGAAGTAGDVPLAVAGPSSGTFQFPGSGAITLDNSMRRLSDFGPQPSTSNGLSGSDSLTTMYHTEESHATSANYPRPKQCYQLQQRRKSIGTIRRCPQNPNNSSTGSGNPPGGGASGTSDQQFLPMNMTDCGLSGNFDDYDSSDSSSSDSDLSETTESESEEEEESNDEFVDMLQKYFDYIDQSSDCSDLTEVSPLSSVSTSPLPPLSENFAQGELDEKIILNFNSMGGAFDDLEEDDELSSGLESDDEDEAIDIPEETEEEDAFASGLEDLGGDVFYEHAPAVAQAKDAIAVQQQGQSFKTNVNAAIASATTTAAAVAFNNLPDLPFVGEGGSFFLRKKEAGSGAPMLQDLASSKSTSGHSTLSTPGDDKSGKGFDCCWPVSSGASGAGKSRSGSAATIAQAGAAGAAAAAGAENVGSSGDGNGGDSSSASTSSLSSFGGSASTSMTGSSHLTGSSNGKRHPKNYTFTPDQMRKIERENHILLRKILDAHGKGHAAHGHHSHGHHHRSKNGHGANHHHHRTRTSSAASLARLRQQKKIEQENALLMKRLQNVKPSKEIEDAFPNNPPPPKKN